MDLTAADFMVQSGNTSIGVFVDGQGTPVVMVHGSIADHTTFDDLVAEVAPTLQTFRMDRRGFGASGDAAEYSIEAEFDDVAAVVDAVTRRTGGPVALFGHSYGANCALGGAVASTGVSHLVLYEPSFGLRYPQGCIDSIEAAIERGDREAEVVVVISTILEMTPADIDAYRRSAVWPDRLPVAHTIAREGRIAEETSFDQCCGRCSVPAPMSTRVGGRTPPRVRRDGHRPRRAMGAALLRRQ